MGNFTNAMAKLSAIVKSMLVSFTILTGKKSTDLVFKASLWKQTDMINQAIILETDQLDANYTLLLFYKGDCPLCEDALIDMANKYQKLKDQNVWVIAISGDKNEPAFEKKLAYHQWPENYCDFTGMSEENFTNYAVIVVPTLYLLEREGVVLKKTVMVDEVVKMIEKKNPVVPS